MHQLTDRQQVVLDFLRQFIATKGYAPTLQDICNALDFKSKNAAVSHLKALNRKGYTKREGRKARTIRVIE